MIAIPIPDQLAGNPVANMHTLVYLLSHPSTVSTRNDLRVRFVHLCNATHRLKHQINDRHIYMHGEFHMNAIEGVKLITINRM